MSIIQELRARLRSIACLYAGVVRVGRMERALARAGVKIPPGRPRFNNEEIQVLSQLVRVEIDKRERRAAAARARRARRAEIPAQD